jgi:hypothetical protein
MSKPEKQIASGVACLIDGVLTKRVQTLGSSVDITREQIQELANSGIVEYIAESPVVSIQIDTNDVGSTDTLAILTDKMLTYTDDVESTGPRAGIHRFFIDAASSNAAYRSITEQDMVDGYCSILATVNEEGTTAKRTMYMNHCAITGVAFSYDVSGNATENYTLTADNKTWFFNGWAQARCYKPINYQIIPGFGDTASPRGIGFQDLSSAIPDLSTVIAVGINNTILRARGNGITGNATFYDNEDMVNVCNNGYLIATTYALSTPFVATTDATTDRCWIVYVPSGATWEATSIATNPGWELESTSGAIGALRKGMIKAYLWNTGTDTESTYTAAGKALRLQTVSIDVALGEEQLHELGTDGFYGISKNTPVPITVTVAANDSDLEYFCALAATSYANSGVKTANVGDFGGANSLRLEIYKEKSQETLLKTIAISNMYVQNENFNVSVGDKAVNEMSFTCDNVTITGSGVNVTGGHFGADS